MRRSTERIITTHVGSLSRPEALREAWSKPANDAAQEQQFEALLRSSVAEVVDQQLKAGVDVPNDGEFGKPMRSNVGPCSLGHVYFWPAVGLRPDASRCGGARPCPSGSTHANCGGEVGTAILCRLLCACCTRTEHGITSGMYRTYLLYRPACTASGLGEPQGGDRCSRCG